MIALGYLLSLLCQNTFMPLIVNFVWSPIFLLTLPYSRMSIFELGRFADIGDLKRSCVVAAVAAVLFLGGYQIEKRLYKRSI